MDYCREISKITKLESGNLSAKVSNYKSVAGVNKVSNASINTVELYQKYGQLSISELEKLVAK